MLPDSAVGAAELRRNSCSDRWAEPHLGAIELTQFSVAEENIEKLIDISKGKGIDISLESLSCLFTNMKTSY